MFALVGEITERIHKVSNFTNFLLDRAPKLSIMSCRGSGTRLSTVSGPPILP